MIKKPDGCVECMSCKFWVSEEKQEAGRDIGQCRVDGPQMGPNSNGYWPRTMAEDFCYKGEEKPIQLLNEDVNLDGSTDLFVTKNEDQMIVIQPPDGFDPLQPPPNVPEPPQPPPKRNIREDVRLFGSDLYTTEWPLSDPEGDE